MHGPDGVLAVPDVLLLAAAATGAGSLEGPGAADFLTSVLGNFDLVVKITQC